MHDNVTVIRSKRKTLSIEITKEATVRVRAPLRMRDSEIAEFLKEKSDWIDRHLRSAEAKKAKMKEIDPISRWELQRLKEEALKVIPKKVEYYAEIIGVTYNKVNIRKQKSIWGSCSAKGDLNFNLLLMKAPDHIQDYVVVHELCHRKEMNHSSRFWHEVEKVIPDYKECRKWLKEQGSLYIRCIE